MSMFVPVEPFPPGEYLQDELDAREWTQEDLSAITGISRRQIANIVAGKSGITPETAKAIAAAFDQDATTWMNLQIAYELASAAVNEREIKARALLHNKLPIREMQRRNWLPSGCGTKELESAVCDFLEIGGIADEPRICVAARKSSTYQFDSPAQMAWYFRVRQLASVAPVIATYRESNWDAGIAELRRLMANVEDARHVPRVLAEMGIRFVILQHLQRSKIDGVALWRDERSPVVGLSLRHDRMDNFWFSLLHELVHIKHKDASSVDEEIGPQVGLPEIEARANEEAASILIDQDKLESFVKRCGPTFQQSRVVQFACSQGVHPHIVAGQLRHRGEIQYSQLTKLNAKVGEHVKGYAVTDGWGDSCILE